ncbi:hypothetical protein [Marinimicrobium sp. ABcell2]|uniref:hypothetical protein n=1 Tax=Marinimicrobium sp. ABcell2 TaxID=3069751 RepID=UPI0027B2B0BB|nr:hypothetical protein [Marinimicrobium sp. ABcell2]MDQ2077465.1 hypothetical protein [Marinimicrobium sp. ABcell2]
MTTTLKERAISMTDESMREVFEQQNSKPEHVSWNESAEKYDALPKYSSIAGRYHQDWLIWRKAIQWQSLQALGEIERVHGIYQHVLRNLVKDIRDDVERGGMAPSWEGVAKTIDIYIDSPEAAETQQAQEGDAQLWFDHLDIEDGAQKILLDKVIDVAPGEAEQKQLEGSDILVTETQYNGAPAKAENDKFSWFHGRSDYLTCKASGRAISRRSNTLRGPKYQMAYNIDESTIVAVRRFWSDLELMEKYVEKTCDN